MRTKLSAEIELCRVHVPEYELSHGPNGAFRLPGPCGRELKIIGSDAVDPEAHGFEHVSVSTERHIPNWLEMCFVKDIFWPEHETVFQLHPPKSDYVNNHPRCLHLWRHVAQDPPLPPSILVGIKDDGSYANKAKADAGYRRAKAKGLIK
jgi:hypothetical protein